MPGEHRRKSVVTFSYTFTGTFEIEHAQDETPVEAFEHMKKAMGYPSLRFLETLYLDGDVNGQSVAARVVVDNECPVCAGSGKEAGRACAWCSGRGFKSPEGPVEDDERAPL